MSYDLFFQPDPGKKLDKKAFAAYFRARTNYQVEDGQAVYQNEDTGVYFIFDEPAEGAVAFNLNYLRPHTFGLEAAPELEAFAAAYSATVVDPQNDGMGEDVPFSREGFLRGWDAGNRFGYQSILKDRADPVHTWPQQRIRDVWEWNYALAQEREKEGDDVFLPTIMAIEVEGKALSVVVWPPNCPILLPAVDAVLVPLAQSGKAGEKVALVPWDEIAPVLQPYAEKRPGSPRYRLAFESWPGPIAEFLNRKRNDAGPLNGIGLDQILDRELVEEVGRR